MTRTSFWITDAEREGATILAELEGRSMGAVIREAIGEKVIRAAKRERPPGEAAARKTGARTPDGVGV